DVVICDLGMPGMTGWEVGKRISEWCREKGVVKTPFALLTGWGDQVREIAKMRSAGVDRILIKPIDVPKLLDALHELAGKGET
ncbi:MAG TPA: response regulator, partial [Desulfomonilaceae bacterium]|nr:response regulator [Desulfomonilaceae bacterium]